jgi:flagellar hook assembly protein FlgD
MKKVVLIVAIIAFSVSTVFATEPDGKKNEENVESKSVQVSKLDEGKFVLKLIDDQGKVDINIYAENGKKVFEDKINYKKPFKKVYDFSRQEEGVYRFEVDGDVELEQQVFYSELHLEDVYSELTEKENGQVELFVRHSNVPVKVRIEDKNGRIVYRRTYFKSSNFKQKFDVSKLSSQELTMTVSGRKSFISYSL